jgi:hypothetical protein
MAAGGRFGKETGRKILCIHLNIELAALACGRRVEKKEADSML